MKNVVLLGSTGSIGKQTLDVLRAAPGEFSLLGICAGHDTAMLVEQAAEFMPRYIGVEDEKAAQTLRAAHGELGARILAGKDAASELAALGEADVVVNAISGFAGMLPLLSALRHGKTVALANKESIVCAHSLVWDALDCCGGRILPIDSEQSAIFQCLAATDYRQDVNRLILTASGGPFREFTLERMQSVTPKMALAHPTWRMGKNITLDSATMFNKGLEIMEAAYLFELPRIDVLIHPESVVHSLVEFVDGSTMAQLSMPDMRLAIAYAMTYPLRAPLGFGALDLAKVGKLTFEAPDEARFPAIRLAYAALAEGEVLPIVYNAAKEAASEMFFMGQIGFTDIARRVEYAMEHAPGGWARSVEDILSIDAQARRLARKE